jgi:hypothetical protein
MSSTQKKSKTEQREGREEATSIHLLSSQTFHVNAIFSLHVTVINAVIVRYEHVKYIYFAKKWC